jgi:hypothetical protein
MAMLTTTYPRPSAKLTEHMAMFTTAHSVRPVKLTEDIGI